VLRGMLRQRHSYKGFAVGFGLPRVLHDIVKRRFVRTPWLECGPRLFRQSAGCASMALVCRGETLNLPHMMGCLTAPPDGSREAGLFVPIPSSEIPHRIWFTRRSLGIRAGGHWQ
jgi:hypothetical protein